MKKVLTDTHALVWALSHPDLLGVRAGESLVECEVFASVANLWELLLKKDKDDTLLRDPLSWWEKYILEMRIPTLSIRTSHVMTLGRLPKIHKDPFDRILAAQSIAESMPLVTRDPCFDAYEVETIW